MLLTRSELRTLVTVKTRRHGRKNRFFPSRRFNQTERGFFRVPVGNQRDLVLTAAVRPPAARETESQAPNRLANEQSPDLVSYASDLVDWYPWGTEAFKTARAEEKLIFLSVGYLSCHWCHVMEVESFNDPKTAKLLNENFIAVKVDREERPDVDRLYTMYVQGSAGYSGWPLNVILTPELDPVFGCTYLPNPSKEGVPSLEEVVVDLLKQWRKDSEAVIETGRDIMKDVRAVLGPEPVPFGAEGEDGKNTVDQIMSACCETLIEAFDERYGGFGEDEKFPRPSSLKLIMRQFLRQSGDADEKTVAYLLKIITYTLGGLHDGGVHDHVGGGFHRFAVDQIWHVPHFEKMLVDNVQIAQCFLSAALMLPQERLMPTARSTLDYLIREMKSSEGAFYTSQDADSFDRETGKATEGAFYIWKCEEIAEVLDEKEFEIFRDYYNVMEEGNCNLAPSENEEEILTNCLVIQEPIREVAKRHGIDESETKRILARCREKLYEKRQERPRPRTDTKIVSGYNGLAISAFAEASRILQNDPNKPSMREFPDCATDPSIYLHTALEIGEFILDKLWDEKRGVLMRFYMNGTSSVPGYAEDYANVVAGFLDLYSCSAELKWLQWAIKLQDKMDEHFWDAAYGGYFVASDDNQSLPFRMKFGFDTEEPSASAVALSNVLRIGAVLKKSTSYETRAREIVEAFTAYKEDYTMALHEFASSACLVDFHPSLLKIVLVGDLGDPEVQDYLNAFYSTYCPSKSLVAVDPSDKKSLDFWKERAPDLIEDLGEVAKPRKASKRKTKKSAKGQSSQGVSSKAVSVFTVAEDRRIVPLESPESLVKWMQEDVEVHPLPVDGDINELDDVVDVLSSASGPL